MESNQLKSATMKNNDCKIIGRMTEKRREKIKTSNQFQTRKFKTEMSNWTPVVHKPSNEQIYKERRELICNWFQLWTDSQRRRFLDMIFTQCRQAQLRFVQHWFNSKVPLKNVDFSRVLPRFLTLYIFSFLDPRSLCRASSVCWQWKFLTEQDILWMRKCTQLGWYLPYTPSANEYGAWKKHYVVCMFNLHTTPPTSASNLTVELNKKMMRKREEKQKSRSLTLAESQEMLGRRPPWLPPDSYPQDLEQGWRCLQQSFDPNDNITPASQLLFHNKFGILKSLLMSDSDAGEKTGKQTVVGLQSAERMANHHLLQANGNTEHAKAKQFLSRSLELESYSEKRLMELVQQPWEPPKKVLFSTRTDLSGGGEYPLPWQTADVYKVNQGYHLSIKHPHVIFISSRVPAAELLMDAILFGVIPVVYEYEGATLEALLTRLDACLQGRNAQSIGLFVHNTVPWEINLVQGSTVTLENLNEAKFVDFFTSVANHVQPPSNQGHIDIFVPVASCESGAEMLIQLSILTGIQFYSPSGIVGNYNHINGPWSMNLEYTNPTDMYFCASKVDVWTNIADQVNEACQKTKALIGRYFEQHQVDLVSQIVGQIILDMTCQLNLPRLDHIRRVLVEALLQLQMEHNVEPLQFLGEFLSSKAPTNGTKEQTSKMGKISRADTLTAHLELDEKFEGSLGESDQTDLNERKKTDLNAEVYKGIDEDKDHDSADDDSIIEEIMSEEEEEKENEKPEEKLVKKIPQLMRSESPAIVKGLLRTQSNFENTNVENTNLENTSVENTNLENTSVWGDTQTTMHTNVCSHQTKLQAEASDRRTHLAKEILSSELKYKHKLDIVRLVFYKPLKSALESNRAILSLQNVNIIFTDILMLRNISRDLLRDLQARIQDWQAYSCLGDVFVKFSAWLKAYVNFFNNYPVILRNIDRCMEQTPAFRAFLKRHQRTPDTNMQTLPQLLLVPSKRINEYIMLLSSFRAYTPPAHADQLDLNAAITSLHEVNSLIEQFKLHGERERELMRLQKQIIACPTLLEANRYFLKQLDVNHLKTHTHHIDMKCRTYEHFETLGLFLFNDSLVVTRRTCRHIAFECCVEFMYRFDTCVSLCRLRVQNIPDSKYVQNAMQIYTPKRQWICSCETKQEKDTWISLLRNTIRGQLTTK